SLLHEGVALFNRGKFWEAHEVWEELWKRRREESRIFFQGIIQAAAAYHRTVTDPKYTGAVNNLEKALQKLQLFPERFLGIDVGELRRRLQAARSELVKLGPAGMRNFPEKLLPTIRFTSSDTR
ncbi:MAG: DUF309 domain-containing protein, partial [Bacteroidota bacterium]